MDLNQAVITTVYVIKNKSKVVYAFHSEEGWQFFGEEKNVREGDAIVTSLATILESNPHVKEILWISEGMEAWVNSRNEWQTGINNSV